MYFVRSSLQQLFTFSSFIRLETSLFSLHREQEVSQTKNNNNWSEHQEREIRQESNLTNQYEETPSG